MRLDPQVQRLYEQLERELDSFPAGTRFYSLHEIATKFRVHRRVIDATILQMKSRGLIESIPRVGCFSKVTRKPDSRRILLAEPDWPSGTTSRWSCIPSRRRRSSWTCPRRPSPRPPPSWPPRPPSCPTRRLWTPSTMTPPASPCPTRRRMPRPGTTPSPWCRRRPPMPPTQPDRSSEEDSTGEENR